jgi:DNA-binding MurR/RpiR family transcriptional regulator
LRSCRAISTSCAHRSSPSASLPKRIAQIAAYALDNPDETAFGTAASIAVSAGVQPSTLIRFAQHLGFDGFTSLQGVFRERCASAQFQL